ncbi:MAG: hypothetical protein HY350_05195 [Candidatus Omnitrophica bacterium]|nr:hypothetical protein [Candidatus Omnitrophota bacterium]
MKPATVIVTILLVLISIGHLLRIIFQAKVTVNEINIPLWISIIGVIVPAALAIMLYRENKKL